ncbi:MAG: PQQ-binding-like beta-propeller repeat protein [Planctomycetota bacterium]
MRRTSRRKIRLLATSASLVVIALVLCPKAGGTEHQDWPYWRGPNRNGMTEDANWDPQALSEAVKFRWRKPVGEAFSSLVVSGKYLYTLGALGQKPNVTQYAVHCFDADTGRKVWQFPFPASSDLRYCPNSTPVVDEGLVYCLSNRGTLYCLDAPTGELKWERDLVKLFRAVAPEYEFSSSPCIEGDLVIVNACRSGVALNKKTGKRKWISAKGKCGYATPVIVEKGKKKYAAIFAEKSLNLVDVRTGRVKFAKPWVTMHNANCADPAVSGKYLFITSNYRKGCALLNIGNGATMWTNEDMCSIYPSPVIMDGYVYGVDGQVGRSTTNLKCLDMKSGRVKWTGNTGSGSFIVADGKLVFLGMKGQLMVVKADAGSFQIISQCSIFKGRKGSTSFPAAPALCRGRIYCRSRTGMIYCIDVSKK